MLNYLDDLNTVEINYEAFVKKEKLKCETHCIRC